MHRDKSTIYLKSYEVYTWEAVLFRVAHYDIAT